MSRASLLFGERLLKKIGDQGTVELLDYMGDENAVVNAARVSYDRSAADFDDERNMKLLRYLIRNKHHSPLEMVHFKFRVKAPVVVWWQWVRHRMASYNLQSGRYTEYDLEIYRPDSWRVQSSTNKQGSDGDLSAPLQDLTHDEYTELMEHSFSVYERWIKRGIAKEQARLCLPGFALFHTGIISMNLRSLMNFLVLRQDDHAQAEIRIYADAIRDLVSRTHPRLMKVLFDEA